MNVFDGREREKVGRKKKRDELEREEWRTKQNETKRNETKRNERGEQAPRRINLADENDRRRSDPGEVLTRFYITGFHDDQLTA